MATNLEIQIENFLRSAELFRQLDEPWHRIGRLNAAALVASHMGNFTFASKLQSEAYELGLVVGEPGLIGTVLINLAYGEVTAGKIEAGIQRMQEAEQLLQIAGDLDLLASAELHFGVLIGWTGNFAEAHKILEHAVPLRLHYGDRYEWTYGMVGLGICEMELGEYGKATDTLQQALNATRQDDFAREEAFLLICLGCITLTHADISQACLHIQKGVTQYRSMQFAGELGMALGGLALTQHMIGNEAKAWETLPEALSVAIKTRDRFTMFSLPATLVVMLADAGRWEQTVEAYSAVMTDPIVANSRWFADMVGNRIDLAREHLPEDVRLAAEARGRESDVFDVLGRLSQEIGSWGMAPGG